MQSHCVSGVEWLRETGAQFKRCSACDSYPALRRCARGCMSDLYSLSVSSPFAVRYPCECDAATRSACEADELTRGRDGTDSASRTPGPTVAAAAAAALNDDDSSPALDPRRLLDLRAEDDDPEASLGRRRLRLRLRLAGLAARCDDDEEEVLSLFLTLRGRERERVRATIVDGGQSEQKRHSGTLSRTLRHSSNSTSTHSTTTTAQPPDACWPNRTGSLVRVHRWSRNRA